MTEITAKEIILKNRAGEYLIPYTIPYTAGDGISISADSVISATGDNDKIGVKRYSATETYALNDFVINYSDDGTTMYRSLMDDNLGNALTDTASWEEIDLGGSGDYVTLDTAQTISGAKTFTGGINPNEFISVGCLSSEATKATALRIGENNSDATYTNVHLGANRGDNKTYNFLGVNEGNGSTETTIGYNQNNGSTKISIGSSGAYTLSKGTSTISIGATYGNSTSTVQIGTSGKESQTTISAYGSSFTYNGVEIANADLSNLTSTGTTACAHYAMPSDTKVSLTMGASGTYYTAPADGWFYILFKITSSNYYALFTVQTSTAHNNEIFSVGANATAPVGGYVRLTIPVRKGLIVFVEYAYCTAYGGQFIYAVGSEPTT